MNKWLIPLLLALAVFCTVLFHIILPLQHGIQINTVDAYYMLRYAELWPNIPTHDYFFNYSEGITPMSTMVFPAMIALTASLFHTDTITAGAWIPPILFLLTLIPVYITTRSLFKSNLIASGSVFLLAIMPGEIIYRTMLGAADYHCLEIFLVTTIMMFGILAMKKPEYWGFAFFFTVIYFKSWAGALLIPFIFVIFLIIAYYKRWQVWAIAGILGIISIWTGSGTLGINFFTLALDIKSTVSETSPLFFINGQFDISAMLAYFSITFFLALFGLGVLIHQYTKSKNKELLLFLVWSTIMLALTFSMKRFAYYSAINIAIITAFASVYIINIFKASRKRVLELAAALLLICLVFGYRSTITIASDFGKMPVAWQECCNWLKIQTDKIVYPTAYWADNLTKVCFDWSRLEAPPPDYFTGKDPSYGVLSHWNYGYWIVEAGHMPVSNTPGNWRGNDILCKADLSEDITKNKWKYIVLDEEMFTTNAQSIFYSNNIKPEDTAVHKMFYFGTPVWQSENGKVKVFETSN